MKNFIIGIFVGILLTGTAWAYSRQVKIQSADGTAISASNPLQVVAY